VAGEPPLDTGLLVRRHIVEDDVDLAARIGPGEEVEENEQFDGSVLGRGPGRDDAGGDLECGRQGERGVALVVVGVAFDLPGPEGQHRQRPIERVDLGLLVDRQNDRPRGRAEGEPAHVGPLGYELGIAAELERLGPVGPQAALPPDPQDRVRADPDGLRQAVSAPVGRPLRWGEGRGHDPLADLPAVDRRPTGPRTIDEAEQAAFPNTAPPQPDRRDGDAEFASDRHLGDPFGRSQDDLRAHRGALLGRARAGRRPPRLQLRTRSQPTEVRRLAVFSIAAADIRTDDPHVERDTEVLGSARRRSLGRPPLHLGHCRTDLYGC